MDVTGDKVETRFAMLERAFFRPVISSMSFQRHRAALRRVLNRLRRLVLLKGTA
jgi:hypothetical protein